MVRPAGKRAVITHLVEAHGLSERRACRLAGLNLSTWQYRARRQERSALRERLKELASQRRRFGYRRLHALLRREGWRINHKAVHRMYVEEGLQVRQRKRKRLARVERQPMLMPQAPNQRWSMDFQHDLLATGQRVRTLNIVDDFSRECPAIEVDTSLPGARVVRVLERFAETRGLPKEIILDNGPEMIGKVLDQWAWRNGVRLHFIDLGKPTQNPFIESFNGRFRDECLNENDPGSVEILFQACASADRAERCRAIIDQDGELVRTKAGTRSHPLLRDELNNRALTARLIGRLGLDLEPVRSPGRPGGPGFA